MGPSGLREYLHEWAVLTGRQAPWSAEKKRLYTYIAPWVHRSYVNSVPLSENLMKLNIVLQKKSRFWYGAPRSNRRFPAVKTACLSPTSQPHIPMSTRLLAGGWARVASFKIVKAGQWVTTIPPTQRQEAFHSFDKPVGWHPGPCYQFLCIPEPAFKMQAW